MSKSTKSVAPATPVTAKTIRLAFQNGDLDATQVVDAKGNPVPTNSVLGAGGDASRVRGRLNPAFVAAYVEANPGTTYAEKSGAKDEAQVTLALTKPNARGAMLKRPEAFPVSQVRALAGQPKGRLSAKSVQTATEKVMAERGWLKV